MHRPPEKLKKGWKLHRDSYNKLLDYVERIKPLPFHGHTQTTTGTMPPPQQKQKQNQFDYVLYGENAGNTSNAQLRISPGYVFAAYRDADQTTTAATSPEIQQWPFEPTLEETGTKLTDDTAPTIQLSKNSANYIYLQLNWTAHEYLIGSSDHDSDYAFKAEQHTHVVGGYTDSADVGSGSGSSHLHVLGSSVTVSNADVFLKVKKIFYTLNTAKFKKYTTQQPPIENDTTTYIAAGVINLDANGLVEKGNSPQVSGIRWFLQGPIYAHKPDNYISGTTHDRVEPIPPRQPEDYIYPGAENTA